MNKLQKGYTQIYTGDGKGKTTAALGLAMRAVGAGLKVYIAQFLKGMKYSEHTTIEQKFKDEITLEQFGTDKYIIGEPEPEHFEVCTKGIARVKSILEAGEHNIVILDEIIMLVFFKIVSVDAILEIIDLKPDNVELILTGRRAPKKLIDRADLVTEMKEIKHYFQVGVQARLGIED